MKITRIVCVFSLLALAQAPAMPVAHAQGKAQGKARGKIARKAAPRKTAKAAPKKVASSREARRQIAIGYVKRAAVAYQKRDYKTVVALCKAASNLAPTYARAYAWSGAAQQKLGNYSQARADYRWVMALAPNTPDAARAQRGLREIGAS